MKLAGIELLLLLLVYPFTNCANVTSKDSGNAENVPRGSLDRTSLNSTQGTKNDTNNLADILQNNISNQTDKAANQTTTQPTTLTPTTTTTLPPWKETPLHIGIMVPDALKDQCIQAAIELAFEDVGKHPRLIQYSGSNMERNNPTFIREYYKLTPYYSEVDLNISIAVQTLHDNYMKGPLKNALIGPPYERLQYDFIEYSSVLGGTHISYTDIDEPIEPYYVFFVPTPPSINHQFKAAVALMDHFQWRRFGILYDFSDSKYRRNSGTLRESILLYSQHKEETDVLTEIGIWSQKVDYSKLNQKMDILKKNDRRIILSLFSVRGARLVFCQAYHKKMYKPKIVWVLFEKLKDGWAKPLVDGTKDVNCTEGQLLEAAHGHIFITKQILRRDGVPNISNMTSNQFLKRIRQKVNSNKCSDDIGYAYDSIWVLAKGYEILSKSTWPRFYYYYNYAFGYLFAGTLKRINFEGLTGSFHYERDRSLHKRLGQIAFYKYHKDGNHVYLGTHHTKTGKLDIIPNMVYKIFNSDKIPKDKAIISYTYADIEKPLWITMWVIAFLGIIIALIVLVVILLYSNNTSYKIGSPILNCVMIFGAILCYTSVIIYSLDTRLVNEDKIPKVCFTFLCALTIGFTMTFGALFAKTWGLYKTFVTPPNHNNQQADIKHVPEWVLLTMVGAFLLIDIVLLISWGFMAPFHASLQVIYTNENFFADTVKTGQVVRCNCQYFIQLLIGLCCYKGVLLLIGIFLAWQLKSTKIQVQNEAKQIAIAIYNVFAVSIIGVICVSVLLNTKLHQALYAIVAICILICTTFTLLLVFVPKIKAILYPELEKPQPASTMKKEIYLRHSQRQYSRKQSHHRTSHTELSSTFSTGTLNTQLSVESTSTVYGKDTNQHPALQDTLSSGSVVSYPPEYLSSIPSSNNQSTVLADIDEPITIEESNHVTNDDIQETGQKRAITHGGHRDSGLGDDSPNLDHILLTLKDKEIQENKENMEKDITNIGNPNDLGEDTSSLNLTPKSSDGMLDE